MVGKSKNILLLGGTGPSGIITLRVALERGHKVTVYARNPSKIPEDLASRPNCTIIQGTLPDTTKLFSLLPRTDTIISLLGPIGLRNHNTEVSDLYSALLAHLKTSTTPTHPTPHVLALTTISFKRPSDSFPFLAYLMVNLVWLFINGAYTEVLRIGDVFEKEGAGLPWTNYRVAYLGAEEGDWLEEARAGSVGVGGWNLRTERKELALWLVGEAERGPEGSQWIGKFPAIFGGRGKGKGE